VSFELPAILRIGATALGSPSFPRAVIMVLQFGELGRIEINGSTAFLSPIMPRASTTATFIKGPSLYLRDLISGSTAFLSPKIPRASAALDLTLSSSSSSNFISGSTAYV
jgi:hypothetical protein